MIIFGNQVQLRDKQPEDARQDYLWETDPEIARLDARPALRIMFAEYQRQHMLALKNPMPGSRLFAIIAPDGEHIGNCMYYRLRHSDDISIGIIIGNRDYWGKGYGSDAILTLCRNVFATQGVTRIRLRTLHWNERALNCFRRCGFVDIEQRDIRGYHFIVMEITRQNFQKQMDSSPRPESRHR